MFGALRLVLALGVVLAHLAWGNYVGRFSVFAFYVISGYLMCLVLDRRYGFSLRGFGGYALNRFLRIFPPYWAACGLSALLLLYYGDPRFGVLWYPWALPDGLGAWLAQLSIVGLDPGNANRLVGPAWALRVELFYYVAIGLGLGRGRLVAVTWLLASVGWHAVLASQSAGWEERYYAIPAASLAFSLGACAYHFRDQIGRWVTRPAPVAGGVATVWVANVVFVAVFQQGGTFWPFYVACGLSAALVALLAQPIDAPQRLKQVDARLGDMSYPIYLVHMQVGFWIASASGLPHYGWTLLAAALPAILLVAYGLLRSVDDPVEALRGRVRNRHGSTETRAAG